MARQFLLSASMVVASLALSAPIAQATLPGDRTVTFNIRQDPGDTGSAVIWKLSLDLHAEDLRGSSVGWDVERIEIRNYNTSGTLVRWWALDDPTVPGMDGLWWVAHADTQNPATNEFDMPPHMTGQATSQTSGVADLDYEFNGVPYEPPAPPAEPPYDGKVAALDYFFILEDGSTPESEGDDEDVEIIVTG